MKLGRLVSFKNLPAGSLFVYGKSIGLKSEYHLPNGAIDAHLYKSGEQFWGGTTNAKDQGNLLVREIELDEFNIENLKTSNEWYELVPKEYGLVIYDADGWDRSNFQYSFYEELISKEEFMMRIADSTCMCKVGFHTAKW